MLAEANRQIRLAFDTADAQRLAQQRYVAPMAYLDELISRLEELQLKGTTQLPRFFKPGLYRVSELLPARRDRPFIVGASHRSRDRSVLRFARTRAVGTKEVAP